MSGTLATPTQWARFTDIRRRRFSPVPWVVGLFALTFLLQRISIPNLNISVTIPLAVLWAAASLVVGVTSLNRTRTLVWLGAAGFSGLLVVAQIVFVTTSYISFNSWALWIVMWLPAVLQFNDRGTATYLHVARAIGNVGLALSGLSIAFMAVQVAGLRYYDWLSTVLPANLLVQDYIISYPIVYGSTYYKSNGWIALEPSFISFMIGCTLICALIARMSVVKVLVLVAGLFSTVAGSGIALLVVFVFVIVLEGRVLSLRKYFVPTLVIGLIFGTTVFGEAVFGRVSEVGSANSSTSLRSIEPYIQLFPRWIADPAGIFVGYGPGSSADIVNHLGIEGLLVPVVAKMIFDYGILGGAGLLALVLITFVRGPSRALAIALAVSLLAIQGAAQPLVICSILLVTLFSPTPPPDRVVDRGRRLAAPSSDRR